MKLKVGDIRKEIARRGRDLVQIARVWVTGLDPHQSGNFLREQHLPFRVRIEKMLGNRPRLKVRKRLDVDRFNGHQLVQVSPSYLFSPSTSGTVINASKLLLNRDGVICRSYGARHLLLQNSTHTAGWDLIEHSGGTTFLQLDSDNEQLLESYVLNQKLIGWNRTHIVYRDLEPWDCSYPDRGVVLFGSYMNQWGHFVIDLAFRLIDNIDPNAKHDIFIQEGTPANAKEIIKMFAPNSELWEVPVGKSITLKDSIVPLPRTLCPVGWKPEIHAHENGWGWSIDGPAVRKLPKVPPQEQTGKLARKIFLHRVQKNSSITNLNEVNRFLKAREFEFIQAEKLELNELLALLGEAEVVVASQGSHLLNLMFLEESTTVVLLVGPLAGIAGAGSALLQAGHKCITVVCDWKDVQEATPYERKQAPILVDLISLDKALSRINI